MPEFRDQVNSRMTKNIAIVLTWRNNLACFVSAQVVAYYSGQK